MTRAGRSAESGQAVLGVILAVLLAGLAWEALATATVTSDARMVLQNGLDAGTTTGAAVMADGLNTLAITNGALLALGVSALLGWGEGAHWARQLQDFQDQVVARTPGLARGAAWGTAVAEGGGLAETRTGGVGEPKLMVRRVYFLSWLFGSRFPLWIADDFHSVAGCRWGSRVLYLHGVTVARGAGAAVPLQADSGAAATCPGSGRSSWPMLTPGFQSRLIPVKPGGG